MNRVVEDSTNQGPNATQEPPHLLASYVLFVLTAAIIAGLFALPLFKVSTVRVVGTNMQTRALVSASNAVGRDIFTIRGSGVVDDLQKVPDVMVTGVSIALPNSITIHARPRLPVIGWREGHTIFLADKYGRLISTVAKSPYPVIDNFSGQKYDLGGYVPSSVILGATYVRRQLPHAEIYGFALGEKRGLMIHSAEGWTAVLGTPTGRALATRVATLQQVIQTTRSNGQHLTHVDLRTRQPYVSTSP